MNDTRLNAADRCDGCGARAYVRVTISGVDLLFGAHHARVYSVRLQEVADAWHDETDFLYEAEEARTSA